MRTWTWGQHYKMLIALSLLFQFSPHLYFKNSFSTPTCVLEQDKGGGDIT
jgi:hypothetical protein